jgi:DNA-binding HxlR family transcriptional regulator
MAGPKLSYQHFCPAARALEIVGEKWALLIVRDLLAGPRRFADLRRSLAAITPKRLSERLRELEEAGVIARDAAGQREVWYRLTPRGQALRPVVDELIVWGVEHALRPPLPGEVVHPGRATDAIVTYLNRRGVRLAHPVTWLVRFGADVSYVIRFDGEHWSRQRGEALADVTIDTTPDEWATFLTASPTVRESALWAGLAEARVTGTPERIEECAKTLGRPESPATRADSGRSVVSA